MLNRDLLAETGRTNASEMTATVVVSRTRALLFTNLVGMSIVERTQRWRKLAIECIDHYK